MDKSADEILQSLDDFGMDDEKTNSDSDNTTSNKIEPSWILESSMFKSVIESPMFKSMENKTRKRYRKTWLNFINFHGITSDNEPVEEDFTNWFAIRKSNGMCLTTLKAEYSHINKCVQILYGYSLSKKWPNLWRFIAEWPTEEEREVKKPCFFKNGQLERYFEEIDMKNCYLLVRGTVAVLTYYYNHIYWIKSYMKWKGKVIFYILHLFLKNISYFYFQKFLRQFKTPSNFTHIFTDIKKCPEGYLFKFSHPAKHQSSNMTHTEFLVPKKAEKMFAILDEYVKKVNQELSPVSNDEIFYTGRVFADGTSKFIRGYLGIKEIRGVPKHVAERLKLETPENYTKHSFLNLNVFGTEQPPSKKGKILDFQNEPAFDIEIQNEPCDTKEDLMSKYNLQLPIEITRKNSSKDFQATTGPSENTEIQNKPFEIKENLMSKYNLKLPIELSRITSKAEFENEPSGMEIENESFTVSSKSSKKL